MEIKVSYGSNTKLTEDEISQIIKTSKKYGNVKVEKWGIRFGAIDILTSVEIVLGYALVKALMKPIAEGYVKGFVNEPLFEKIGIRHRLAIKKEIKQIKNFLKAFYEVFIVKKTTESESIALVEYIEDCTLFVTLNSYQISEKLINNLAEALVKTFALVSLKIIDVEHPKVIQLYPNFESQEWDYLFVPTVNAFGKFIDRYYCFSEEKMHSIFSANDFIEKFQITDMDDYKFIINPRER